VAPADLEVEASCGLLERIFRQCGCGNAAKASTSSRASEQHDAWLAGRRARRRVAHRALPVTETLLVCSLETNTTRMALWPLAIRLTDYLHRIRGLYLS